MPKPLLTQLKAVLFDWAGTTIDYGSREPAMVFVEVFRQLGIAITMPEAREPMGLAKRDHFAALLAMPRIAAEWQRVHGRPPADSDCDRLMIDFLPLQKGTLQANSQVIPGVVDTVAECRRRGLRIGSTTGYYRELMDVVCPITAAAGFSPDAVITPDDVPQGRPAPWMNFRAAEKLGVYPPAAVVAVDDTQAGIDAGRNAGMWTVAISKTGNAFGLSEAEVAALPKAELAARLETITALFRAGGAHFVIEGVADLCPILDEINARLAKGER